MPKTTSTSVEEVVKGVKERGASPENADLITKIAKGVDGLNQDKGVFDSLSTLLIYNNESGVSKFVHNLASKIEETEVIGVFTALSEDASSVMKKSIGMSVTNVIKMK